MRNGGGIICTEAEHATGEGNQSKTDEKRKQCERRVPIQCERAVK